MRIEILLRWYNINPNSFIKWNGRRASGLLGWGFAFAFDLAAITSELAGSASSSCGLARFLSVVLDVIVHITNGSVGNSDPRLRIVFLHRLNSHFNSKFEVLKSSS